MSLYAIGDLHFSKAVNKPMHIFGDNWHNHEEKITMNWKNVIKDDDIVLVLGDTSWGTKLEEAKQDFTNMENMLFVEVEDGYVQTTLSLMKMMTKYIKEKLTE